MRLELLFLFLLSEPELPLLLELCEGRDSDEIALPHHSKTLGLEHDVKDLVPRHVPHSDRNRSADIVGGDDIHVSCVCQQPENVVDIRVLQIDVDPTTGITLLSKDAGRARREPGSAARRGLDYRAFVVNRSLDAGRIRGPLLARDRNPMADGASVFSDLSLAIPAELSPPSRPQRRLPARPGPDDR